MQTTFTLLVQGWRPVRPWMVYAVPFFLETGKDAWYWLMFPVHAFLKIFIIPVYKVFGFSQG
ncbi:MAG: hypothetical protein NPIRA03_19880 [Nitrospirales bacterium]|nr:MAG: hypothetical protein NPIRA03_19880 [Nitrospirales bacterium]